MAFNFTCLTLLYHGKTSISLFHIQKLGTINMIIALAPSWKCCKNFCMLHKTIKVRVMLIINPMKLFLHLAFNYFHKKLRLRCLTWFWIQLWFLFTTSKAHTSLWIVFKSKLLACSNFSSFWCWLSF